MPGATPCDVCLHCWALMHSSYFLSAAVLVPCKSLGRLFQQQQCGLTVLACIVSSHHACCNLIAVMQRLDHEKKAWCRLNEQQHQEFTLKLQWMQQHCEQTVQQEQLQHAEQVIPCPRLGLHNLSSTPRRSYQQRCLQTIDI